MAGAVSRWLGAIEDLPLIAQRLLRVQIENDDAKLFLVQLALKMQVVKLHQRLQVEPESFFVGLYNGCFLHLSTLR